MNMSSLVQAVSRVTARGRNLAARARGAPAAFDELDVVATLVAAVNALERRAAPNALIGGVAVALRCGESRAVDGIDLAVHTSHRGAELVQAMVDSGFELRGEFAHSVNFRHASGEPLQLAFDPEFDPMIARAEVFELEGCEVRIVTKPDLVAMKRRAADAPGRRRSKALRDAADVELLLGDVPEPDEGW